MHLKHILGHSRSFLIRQFLTKLYTHRRPTAAIAVCNGITIHDLCQLTDNGKSEARAFFFQQTRIRDIGTKRISDLFSGHTHSGIFDVIGDLYLFRRDDRHLKTTGDRAVIGKFDRIGDQVLNDLPHTHPIPIQIFRKRIFHDHPKLHRLIFQIHKGNVCLFFQKLFEMIHLRMQIKAAILKLGKIQD